MSLPKKEREVPILHLGDDDWATEDLPRPTGSEFLAVLEGLKELYNDRWQKDFKVAVEFAKATLAKGGDR